MLKQIPVYVPLCCRLLQALGLCKVTYIRDSLTNCHGNIILNRINNDVGRRQTKVERNTGANEGLYMPCFHVSKQIPQYFK